LIISSSSSFLFLLLLSLQYGESKFQCCSKKTGANLEQTHYVSSSTLLHGILPKNTVSYKLCPPRPPQKNRTRSSLSKNKKVGAEEEEEEWVLVQFLGKGSLQGNNITTNVTNK
jgi:hypothetical protein